MAGYLSRGAVAFWSITIVVLAGGCDHPRSTLQDATAASHEVTEVSPALIGKQITIRGKFSLWGKIGPYIELDSQQAVYFIPSGSFAWGKPYSEMEGKLVTATGILRFYHSPPAKRTDRYEARPFDHYYFEAESAQLRLVSR